MTAPCDPDDTPEARDEEQQEITLRLGEILPRVPAHLLKPGPHDGMLPVRFSVEELAEKIARGRVSVPLERLSPLFPQVFRDSSAFPGQQEIPLPLQKLLEQVGLMARKPPAPNGMPPEQLEQARGEAGRIIEANAGTPVPDFATPPSVHAVRISKAISTARQIFGLFGKPGDSIPDIADSKEVADVNPKEPGKQFSSLTPDTPPVVQSPPPTQAPPEPAVETVPAGFISLRLISIYRLLPVAVLRSGTLPDEGARVALPLSGIDPQLAGGHVEIPLEDFARALPDDLRSGISMVPETKVWIPLDEIFQNLPPDHIFYMPPLDLLSEPAPAPAEEALPEEVPEQKDTPAPDPIPEPPAAPIPEAVSAEPIPEPADAPPDAIEPATIAEAPPESVPVTQDPPPEPADSPPAEDASTPPAPETPSPVADAKPETPPPSVPPIISEPEPIQEIPAPAAPPEPPPEVTPPPSRAPWMHGFQIPAPRLFGRSDAPAEAPSKPEPAAPAASAPTPEAKRTADFLATQPGIFAAAAFVGDAVFASADFPPEPDLDALRKFMDAFVESARENGRRLGWDRILTISCEQYHLTAVVRDSHFIVVLHHDSLLPSPARAALILAADDLSKSGI
jgi:hypothetical protein